MYKTFEICFYTGVIFAVVSVVLGQIFHILNIGLSDLHISVDSPGAGVSPIRPTVIAAFITVFGGVGLMCMDYGQSVLFAVILSSILAFFVSYLLYKFIIVPLYKAQNTSTVSQDKLIGLNAKVKLSIKKKGFGEITYTIRGNSYSSPAKSTRGIDIKAGTDVVIIDIKENVFYVSKI